MYSVINPAFILVLCLAFGYFYDSLCLVLLLIRSEGWMGQMFVISASRWHFSTFTKVNKYVWEVKYFNWNFLPSV